MSPPAIEVDSLEPCYRVGTVAQLTGLSPDTIRAWERRYATVSPRRSAGGTRLYSDEDVVRLQLMKGLTDCGDAIGAIARLTNAQLRERLARHAGRDGSPAAEPEPPRRLAILDADLNEQIRANAAGLGGLEVVVDHEKLDDLLAGLRAQKADVVVLNLDRLGDDPLAAVARCLEAAEARAALVVYDFASRRTLTQLARNGVRLLKAPVRVALLRQAVFDFLDSRRALQMREALLRLTARAPVDPGAVAAPRMYDDAQLARLQEIQTSVECECPSHLSSLIRGLVAFERYSARCQSGSPEDADLHALLERVAGHAREMMEQALAKVCEHDGIRI